VSRWNCTRGFRRSRPSGPSSQSEESSTRTKPGVVEIPIDLFVGYAEEDLGRWREVLGCHAGSRDTRRGPGRLSDVRWATYGAGVAPHIQVCVTYEGGFTSWIRGASFGEVHTELCVPKPLAQMLNAAAQADDETQRSQILDRWSADRQQAEDAYRLQRIEELQDTVRRRNSAGSHPANK